jgi:hypothetical protein
VLIKVKVHPCLDLNFAGSRQKNGLWTITQRLGEELG